MENPLWRERKAKFKVRAKHNAQKTQYASSNYSATAA